MTLIIIFSTIPVRSNSQTKFNMKQAKKKKINPVIIIDS